jgi:hypothetical protein
MGQIGDKWDKGRQTRQIQDKVETNRDKVETKPETNGDIVDKQERHYSSLAYYLWASKPGQTFY